MIRINYLIKKMTLLKTLIPVIIAVFSLSSCGYILESEFLSVMGEGWWDNSWLNRRELTFDNSSQSENLLDFPVLIKLDSTRIDYNKTQNSGEDIRFIDADGTELKYEIEEWNESGESFIWVKVPQIDAASNADYIWMYYGNSFATDGQDSTNVWDANYIGVWHLNESTGASPMLDSTVNTNNGTPEGTLTRIAGGAAGGAQDFDAGADRINIGINLGATVTISTWAKLDTQGGMLWCLDTAGGPDLYFTGGIIYLNTWDGTGNPFCMQPASVNLWHYYSSVISPANTELYIDGILCGTAIYRDPTETIIYIGSSDAGYTWDGSVDEFRISNIVRSADWTKAQYDSMSDTFITFGIEE